eukprot:TRINITY_DN1463_c0_g3_i2.p1 TRINITY_DN1463_c0_g3~~TRINITY_DN1463_c0_g3_i2.p1  ORF type:complete len:106 (-),score=39.81 TRINITY_DN1463_c0_g3_i2:18-335(-)
MCCFIFIFVLFFCFVFFFFFFQAEDGIRDVERSRGLGDVYKRQVSTQSTWEQSFIQILRGMNYSDEKIMEILTKGLPEYSVDLFQMHAFNPYFRNTLSELNSPYK